MAGRAPILVVDDDELVRSLIAEILKGLGYRCRGVGSGAEARESLRNETYEAVILDFHLGDETAREVLDGGECIQGAPAFLIVSGDATGQARAWAEGRQLAFLPKPFDFREFRDALLRLVGSGSTRPKDV